MKKFKKLTASLMALAITAAGMSSIPASAAYTSYTLYLGTHTALAYVNFIPNQSYTGCTSGQGDDAVFYKYIKVTATKYNGTPVTDMQTQTEWYWDAYATVNVSCKSCRVVSSAKARYKNGSNQFYETPERMHTFWL